MKKIKLWFYFVFGIIIFSYFIHVINFEELIQIISNANLNYFFLAFILGIFATLLKTLRFSFFFPPQKRFIQLYGTFSYLRVLYFILPFNIGEIIYLTTLKKNKFIKTIADAMPAWVYMRFSDVIALSIWLTIILGLSRVNESFYSELVELRYIALSFSTLLVMVLLSSPFWVKRINFNTQNWLLKKIELVKEGFTHIIGIRTFLKTILFSKIIWATLIAWHVFALLSLNVPLKLDSLILASISVYFLSLIPINTPLNLGTDEASWTGVLVISGIEFERAIIFALSMRVINMTILLFDGIWGGSIVLKTWKENNN